MARAAPPPDIERARGLSCERLAALTALVAVVSVGTPAWKKFVRFTGGP